MNRKVVWLSLGAHDGEKAKAEACESVTAHLSLQKGSDCMKAITVDTLLTQTASVDTKR